MTPQEQQMIQSLITRVNQTRLTDKDPDAERLLQQSLGQNPDAIYILAQTVIVQGYALEQAQKQLADARNQLQHTPQQQPHTSFLGSLFGHSDPPPPPPPDYQAQTGYNQQPPPYTPVSNQASGYIQAPPQSYGAPAPAGGGFLRGAMQTAAGVAAGALAFQGVESLMHGFGNAAGYGNENLGGFGGGGQPREEIINNYYGDRDDRSDSSDSSDRSDRSDRSDFDAAADNNGSLSPDIEDRRDDLSGDPNDTGGTDDSNNFDDNSGGDDSGNFDNGGDSFDNSGGGFDNGGGDDSNFS